MAITSRARREEKDQSRARSGAPPVETEIKHTAGGEMPDTSITAELGQKAQDYAIAAAAEARSRKRLFLGIGGAAGLLAVGGGAYYFFRKR